MKQYECLICGWVYDEREGDPEENVSPGTAFETIPESWRCPMCGAKKAVFSPLEKEKTN